VHDVQVEIVDSPVCKLLSADGLDGMGVVEGVPELGDEEEIGALYEAFFYGAGDALAGFGFIAVVWGWVLGLMGSGRKGGKGGRGTYHMLHQTIGSLL